MRPILLLAAAGLVSVACESDPQGTTQVQQPPSLTDLPSLCRDVAEPCGDEGATECSGAGVRECVEVAGCLQWGFVTGCDSGTSCMAGECRAACAGQPCTLIGATKCSPTQGREILRCDDYDGDGCLEWGGPSSCQGGQVCDRGACAAMCSDACEAGSLKCEGSAVVGCGEHDGDGCTEWGAPTPCPDGFCAGGQCKSACSDECAVAGLSACDGPGFKVCEQTAEGCLRWGTVQHCAAGRTCSAGVCSQGCTDECALQGQTTCEAGGVKKCGEFDGDPCMEWSLPQPCAAGSTCSDGACDEACSDECTQAGARGCEAGGSDVTSCGDHDADPCLEWATVEQCGAGLVCTQGVCSATCVDECVAGDKRCRPGVSTRVEVCADGDNDPCVEWVAEADCGDWGQVCADGACAASCQNDCQVAGSGVCQQGSATICGQFDDDPCLDWGTPVSCASFEICSDGRCEQLQPPAALKISELLYNADGADTDTFIEIGGPPNTPLGGFTLVGVNAADGSEYVQIPLSGVLDSAGYFVVAHPDAASWISDYADQLDLGADLQNGPDNLILHYGAVTVDALGYGDFGASAHFWGEGAPAAGADVGFSLERDAALSDTDNNVADFRQGLAPTPGAEPLVELVPDVWGDVVITEVMPNPTTVDDKKGEWFEVFNPYVDVAMALQGCVLQAGDKQHPIEGAVTLGPRSYATLARNGEGAGFEADYIYGAIQLTNDGGALTLSCGGVEIDRVSWGQAPVGASISLDPGALDAAANDSAGNWCPGTSVYVGGDRGSPGQPNPPCPASGTYDETILNTEWGVCNATPNWNPFSFAQTQPATTAGELSFQWWAPWCDGFGSPSEIWIELLVGTDWVEVADMSASGPDVVCEWVSDAVPLAAQTINDARDASGTVSGRFRIVDGCQPGVGCGTFDEPSPSNCARKLRLTYAH